MKPLRPWKDVIKDWSQELSIKLGRPEDQILKNGLSAYDFSPTKFVEVRDPTGMVIRVKFAFAVFKKEQKLAAVFSEHSGYIEFDLQEDSVVAEISEEIYRQE